MSPDLREQIHESLNLRETDDLLEIWQAHNSAEWSELAFEVIAEILRERLGEIPPQPAAVHTLDADEDAADLDADDDGPGDGAPDAENAPVFYDPRQVLRLASWLGWVGIAYAIYAILANLQRWPGTLQLVQSFFLQTPQFDFLARLIAVVITGLDIVIAVAICYFPLRALAHVLEILMEMEFNSRKQK